MFAFGALAFAACLAASLLAPPVMAQTLTDLGTLGGDSSQATAINASGQIAGYSVRADGFTHAFLYSNGVMTDLGTLGGSASWASGINSSGAVVGWSYIGAVYSHAFLYSGGSMTDLGSLGLFLDSYATGINDSGVVVGTVGNGDSCLYSKGRITSLNLPPGGTWSQAAGINDSGQVVGQMGAANDATHAFLYSNGVLTDLGTLPGGAGSAATAINNSGQVAGYSSAADAFNHAFLYSDGIMTDLGTLGYSSAAAAINSSGAVVGYAGSASDGTHAFLYSNGVMIDLNSFLPAGSSWFFGYANGINDAGEVVGYISYGALQHAVLLNLATLSPSWAAAGGAAFTLTVTNIGTSFTPGATVNWNGTALATTYMSATELTAIVPANLIAKVGTTSVTVTTTESTLARATFIIHPSRRLPGVPEQPRNIGRNEEQ
ncbi:MAG: HAF repeat-containing protein [Bryobacteraceae bacterium]